MRRRNRVVSIVLILALLFTLLPINTFAAGTTPPVDKPTNEYSNKPESKILGEIEDKREANVKHFLKDDFTFEAVVYPVPVHFLSDGKWQDIDNTLVPQKDEEDNDVLKTTSNDFAVQIAKNTNSKKLVRIQKGQYEVSWNLAGAQNSLGAASNASPDLSNLTENDRKRMVHKVSSQVDFPEVLPNVDLQYNVVGDKIKENLVINSPLANPLTSFSFALNTKNLTPKLEQDNSIIFYDTTDSSKAMFAMQAPFMFDSSGAKSDSIVLALENTNNGYTLTLTPDGEWLNSSDRSYPITIDPTIQTSLGVNDIFDSHVSSGLPDQNNQQAVLLGVGYGSISHVTRTYIKFNLPALTAADLVINASLFLSLYTANSNVRQTDVHKVTGGWESASITWNNAPGYNSTVQDYQMVQGAAGAQSSWDVTSIAKDWYVTGNNFGLMLKNHDETGGYNEFVSSDTSSQYMGYRPQVIIDYINNTGLESYWSYHSQDISRAGTSFVNDYNGNLILVHNDLSMNGNRMPLSLNHVFNSNDKDTNSNTGNYGLGWRLNVSQKIVPQTIGGTQYKVYTDEDGTKHYFSYDSASGTYKDYAGPDLTLTLNGDGTYLIKDKKDNKLTFTSSGYLYLVTDQNGNTLTLSYNGATLTTITDGAGRVTTLDINQYGYLIGIIDPSGRRTSFGYSGAQLTTITYPDGNQTVQSRRESPYFI